MRGNTILDVQDLTRLQDEGHFVGLKSVQILSQVKQLNDCSFGLGLGKRSVFQSF